MAANAAVTSKDNRTIILETAKVLFAEKGLYGTTMTDIANRAKVSRATVFNQFGSKALLLDAIAAESLAGYIALLNLALSDRQTPTVQILQNLCSQMGKGIANNREFYREIYTEIAKATLGFDADGQSQALRQNAYELLVQIHMRGQARRELTTTFLAEDLAQMFDSLMFGTVAGWLQHPGKEALEARMQRALNILLQGICETSAN